MKKYFFAISFFFCSLLAYSQPKANDSLFWSDSRRLEWSDFASKAVIKKGMFSQAAMQMNAKFRKGLKATTSVQAFFDRGKSFAVPEEKTALMLQYFQTMFDLYEAESRKLRKTLKETKLGWDPEKAFQEKYNAALQALEKRADQYMEETENGENKAEIERWAAMLRQEIKAMEAFSK